MHVYNKLEKIMNKGKRKEKTEKANCSFIFKPT